MTKLAKSPSSSLGGPFISTGKWLGFKIGFPNAKLRAAPGLVKVVSRAQIEAADWSLTPERYVDVAPPEEEEDFDFEQTLRDIHTELIDLNKDAVELATKIQGYFEELGVAWPTFKMAEFFRVKHGYAFKRALFVARSQRIAPTTITGELICFWATTLESRGIQPLTDGEAVEMPEVGGLHHHCERRVD